MKPPDPSKISTYSSESQTTLEFCALLGEEIPLEVLAAMGVKPESLDCLFDDGWICEGSSPHLANVLVDADAVRESIPWSRRRQICTALASALAEQGEVSHRLGRLWMCAQRFDDARAVFVSTARTCCENGDFSTALMCCADALDGWPRDRNPADRKDLLHLAIRCARNCSDVPRLREFLKEVLNMVEDSLEKSELYAQLGDAARQQADRVNAVAYLKEAAAAAEQGGDAEAAVRRWSALSAFYASTAQFASALRAIEHAVDQLAAVRSPLSAEVLADRAVLLANQGRYQEAHEQIKKVLDRVVSFGDPTLVSRIYRRHANVLEQSSKYKAYRDKELTTLKRCELAEDRDLVTVCWGCVAYAHFRLGEWKDSTQAIATYQKAEHVEGELDVVAHGVLASMYAGKGERKKAETSFSNAENLLPIHGGDYMQFFGVPALAALAFYEGRNSDCLRMLDDFMVAWKETEDRHDSVHGLVLCAGLEVELGRQERVTRISEAIQSIATTHQNMETQAAREMIRAEEAWAAGKPDSSLASFEKARKLYRESGLLPELAWSGWRMCRVGFRSGREDAVTETRRETESHARRLGLRPMLSALDAESDSGESSDAVLACLTPRQREALQLAADGLSDKEIGARLGISVRTAEMHMGSVLTRLNCRSRSEAVRKWAERE